MSAPTDPPEEVDPLALETLLRWYVAMGVDAAVADEPQDRFSQDRFSQDRFSRGEAPRPEPVGRPPFSLQQALPPQRGPATPQATPAGSAEAVAQGCTTIEELREAWAATPGCGLATTATHMIFAAGDPAAELMIVGGAPDSDDEREGAAFSGSKGRLLDAMLRAIALSRDKVYLANVIPWRPPGNRQPTPAELGFCLPFMRRHIELAAPKVMLCFGERAAQPLLGTSEPVSRLRGRWLAHEGETRAVKTLVTFSLDYLLRQPLQKKRAWTGLLQVAAALRA